MAFFAALPEARHLPDQGFQCGFELLAWRRHRLFPMIESPHGIRVGICAGAELFGVNRKQSGSQNVPFPAFYAEIFDHFYGSDDSLVALSLGDCRRGTRMPASPGAEKVLVARRQASGRPFLPPSVNR
jgi:hypothetical protein